MCDLSFVVVTLQKSFDLSHQAEMLHAALSVSGSHDWWLLGHILSGKVCILYCRGDRQMTVYTKVRDPRYGL